MIDDFHPFILCIICYFNNPYHGNRPNKIFVFKVRHSSICSKYFIFVCSVNARRKLGEQARAPKLTKPLRPGNGNDPGEKLRQCHGTTMFLELSRRLLGPDTPISSPVLSDFCICSSSLVRQFARFSTCWLLFVPKSEIPLEGASLWLDFGHPESRDKYIKHHCKRRLLQRHPETVWPCKSVFTVRRDVCRKLNNKSVIYFTQIFFYNASFKT